MRKLYLVKKNDTQNTVITKAVTGENVWKLGGAADDTGKAEYTTLIFKVTRL